MVQVYLSLGSNIDRENNLKSGLTELTAIYHELTLSSLFESEAVGFDGSPFYNMVVGLQTNQTIEELSKTLREIEYKFGREANAKKFSPRTLDIDILLYGDLVQSEPVQLPRDEISFNAFVLWPLAEIAPQLLHPVLKQSYHSLWQNFDKNTQKLAIIPFNWQG
ncbi:MULTISPECIES: 2-amino-4-hydroxy-6-hydroxymethyldihydropteridine diphosphokinase [Thalassotalea]|uniref:2-amino-4-hydroxy-6-hydroxymethyldihydropteridine diphosphokinase n=1 Tax=Thalassotalea castellviae TaxID=3075612 RepID=A0ABU3A0N6_9GAMM|nr:2-amino-4-hydroxy-6-hydroxymethyldihydropteridine diphosphokinase [Thalassotalea sp. W431]MDT0603438.1 2-amino-4-hydroxy-6-hydroxymethyldihydropteridine diphosphokinase [Thalassotalea sp. W431]